MVALHVQPGPVIEDRHGLPHYPACTLNNLIKAWSLLMLLVPGATMAQGFDDSRQRDLPAR
ncbi:hypothetical protein D3C72_2196810 [compost metagenome]